MTQVMRHLLGLANRVCLAALCGFLGFVPCLLPVDDDAFISVPRPLWEVTCYLFNWPVAAITRLGIPHWVGLDVFYGGGVGEFMWPSEMLVWHMRVAIPVYTLIFYLPAALRLAWRARRQRHHPVPAPL
jgi:hypothetical protein